MCLSVDVLVMNIYIPLLVKYVNDSLVDSKKKRDQKSGKRKKLYD